MTDDYGWGYWEDDENPRCPYCNADELHACEEWCETQRPALEPDLADDNLTTTPSNEPSS